MATPLNISIQPLTEEQRIEDWQPLFIAATSAIVASSTKRIAIQMLSSFVCRNEYEQSTVLEAIKESTLKEAVELLSSSLDPPINEFEARGSNRSILQSASKAGKRAGQPKRAACMALVGELPEARPHLKTWVKGKYGCTEKIMRRVRNVGSMYSHAKGDSSGLWNTNIRGWNKKGSQTNFCEIDNGT